MDEKVSHDLKMIFFCTPNINVLDNRSNPIQLDLENGDKSYMLTKMNSYEFSNNRQFSECLIS